MYKAIFFVQYVFDIKTCKVQIFWKLFANQIVEDHKAAGFLTKIGVDLTDLKIISRVLYADPKYIIFINLVEIVSVV